ncbi:hypothetical protein DA803_01400 [[Mycoplasma] phocae]|uniref:Uncharacterized protein n=1 Tax=[Mycoplasma] phocae TaxID=142651 RepID=A0A2Z5IQ41_9BACT|nr:hypothetical protein [[Mycoplasma] phocae]AXE60740.1 hypothetical protein DA803_01400 [[Mycoplasma] phocae]
MLLINNLPPQEISSTNIRPIFWLENFYVKAERAVYLKKWVNFTERANLAIRRLIKDDKFIIEFQYHNFSSGINDIKVEALINNKKVTFSKEELGGGSYSFSCISEFSPEIQKTLFNDISNVNFEIFILNEKTWYQAERYTYAINSIKNNKQIKIDNNGASINLLTKLNISSIPNAVEPIKMKHYEKREYLNFNFKPIKLELGKFNQKIYDFSLLKIETDGKINKVINQTDIEKLEINAKIDLETIKGNVDLFYNPWDNNKNKEILIDSYSYYDNKLKQTIISANNESSKKGIILPLDFYGNFHYDMDISFGEKLKKFTLIYNQFISKPFFDRNIGLISLEVSNIRGWLTKEKWYTVNHSEVDKIVKHAKSLDEIWKIGGKKS